MKLKKEREVTYLIQKHLDNIKQWLKKASEAVLTYYMEDIDIETILKADRHARTVSAEVVNDIAEQIIATD